MKHICEICNKQYDTVSAAEQCEFAHKKEAAEESAKSTAETKISDAVNAYIARYKELPGIDISAENQKLLLGDVPDKLEKIFNLLIDIFHEDDEEDNKGCCENCDGRCETPITK